MLTNVGLRDTCLDHADDHRVGHEVAAIQVLLRRRTELAAITDSLTKEVTRREVDHAERAGEQLALRALARGRWSGDDDDLSLHSIHLHSIRFVQ